MGTGTFACIQAASYSFVALLAYRRDCYTLHSMLSVFDVFSTHVT